MRGGALSEGVGTPADEVIEDMWDDVPVGFVGEIEDCDSVLEPLVEVEVKLGVEV